MAGHRFRRLDLFVTEACNLACPYCFARQGRARKSLDPAHARRAVDWLLQSEHPRLHITFWGGEPLLRFDLLQQITDHAREQARRRGKRLTLSMPTNATLLDDKAVEWLQRQQVQIFCSIDGEGSGRPLAANGASSYAVALQGLRRARALGPALRMTVTPESAAGHAEAALALAAAGGRQLLIYPAMDRPWTGAALESFAGAQRRLADALVHALEDTDSPDQAPQIKAWRPILRRLVRPTPRTRSGRLMDHQCGAGTELLALATDGSFTPCHRFVFYDRGVDGPRFKLGDLEHGPDPAGSEPFESLRLEHLGGEAGPCVECDAFELCGFGCVAISFASTGNLSRVPPWVCSLMRAQVAACRQVHAALAGDPRLAVYSGVSLAETVGQAARTVSCRAQELLDQSREG